MAQPKYNRKTFFDGFKHELDPTLDQSQVDGISFLLGEFENDDPWTDTRHVAYALATIYHETAGSMQPVEEGYYLGSEKKVKAFQRTLRYFPYFGRGYVQLTWAKNYEKAGKALDLDLVNKPQLALEPKNAFAILTLGMFQGWFTGKKLADYINVDHTDYVNARRIINGTDRAGLIAGYARNFETLLKDSAASSSSKTEDLDGDNANSTSDTSDPATTDPPPIKTVVEQTDTKTKKAGDSTQTTQTTVTADSNVAIEKEEHPTFVQYIWKKVTVATTAVGGTSAITSSAQQAQVFGLTPAFWQSVFTIIAVAVAIWITVEAITWFFTVWLKRRRTEKIAELNSTPTNMVTIVPAGELAKYEKDPAWIVIRRNQ